MIFRRPRSSSLASDAYDSDKTLAPQRPRIGDLTRFSFCWLAIITTTLVSFLVAASQLVVKPLQFQAPISSETNLFFTEVSLTAEFVAVDPLARTMTMNWYPILTSLNCSSEDVVVTEIYLPVSLLDASSPSWTPQPEDQAAFRLNSTLICSNLLQYPSFQTVTKLVASKDDNQLQGISKQATLQNYPFDLYLAPIVLYTRNLKTGVMTMPVVSGSFGVAVNFEIKLLEEYVNQSGNDLNLALFFRIGRSTATKIFVVIVAVTNWLTATAFLTICTATLIYRPHEIYAEMFVVPVGALFAFTSIRANLPGAPTGFGATIDLFTILPVLVIMSFCSFSLLLIILYRRIYQKKMKQKMDYNSGTIIIQGCSTPLSDTPRIPTLRDLPSSTVSL